MAIKKTELYRSLWASCDELRGGMDASQYKQPYILRNMDVIRDKNSLELVGNIEVSGSTILLKDENGHFLCFAQR